MKKVSLVGVIVGGIVDIGSTTILFIPLFVYVGVSLAAAHTPHNQLHSAIANAMHAVPIMLTSLVIGISGSVLGGYVAARIAKHDELLNGALSAYLCVAFGVYALLTANPPVPLWQHLLAFVASPALGLLGGWLRLAQERSRITNVEVNA